MHRFLAALCALLLASCGMDESASPRSETRSWAPRLSYANGATVPKVDYVRLVVTLQDGKGTVLEQQVDWSQGKVVVNGIPSGVAFTAQVKGVLQDGSEVWSGSTDVGSGESGDVAITSKVTVSSAVGIDLALDETALTSPAAGSFPRVLVKNWPYADTDIHVLYTTDESVPTYGMSSTHEYAGPFTLQGSGKLKIRAYRVSANSTTTSSSAILGYGYAGTNPTTCNVPGFLPVPGVLGDAGTVNVALNGTSACELRYRTDGTDPGVSDPLWASSQVTLANGITNIRLRAISTAVNASIMSPVMEGSWSCPNCTQAVVQSIAASGAIDVEVTAGMSTGLGVQLSGATSSQVVWTIEDGSAYAGLVAGGSTAQVNAYATLPTGVTSANVVVRASISGTDKFVKFNVKVVASGSTANSSITAAGSTSFPMNPGNTTWLTASVTGVDPSLVVWSIESGADYASFLSTASGSTVQLQTISALPAGVSNPVVTVKAMIAGTTKSVLYNITVSGTGTSSATLVASGNTTIPVSAGGTVDLSTVVTGALASDVTWGIETGNALVVFESGSTGTAVRMRASTAALSGTATVRATLAGTGTSVLFTLTFGGTSSQGTIAATGTTMLEIPVGGIQELSTTVTGTDPSQVVWTIESGTTLLYFPSLASGSVIQVQAYQIAGTGSLGSATVRASLPGSAGSVLFTLNVNGAKVDTVFAASGETNLSMLAGNGNWLYTNLTGANSSDISWSVDGASTSLTLTPTGTMASITASRILASGKTVDTVTVRARLGTTTREVVFKAAIAGGELLSFKPSGTTTLGLQAGGSLDLVTMVTGKLDPKVTWTVVGGAGTVTPGTSSLVATYKAPAQVAAATDVQVKGVLEGTSLVVNYFITVSARPKLEIVDSTGTVRDLYAPERRTAKYFQARRGSLAEAATWSVDQFPAGGTWLLYDDGDGMRFKPAVTGDYRLIATQDDGADTVTVRWPELPSIVFGPDSVQVLEQGDLAYMYPKVYPLDEPLTWKLGGTATGTLNTGNYYLNGVVVPGAYYQASTTGADTVERVLVDVAFTGDASKSLTYALRVFPRRLVVRNALGIADTSFRVLDTAQGYRLEVFRKGEQAKTASWSIWSQPADNYGGPGTQDGSALLFHPAAAGRYVLQVAVDGLSKEIEVIWGGAR